SSRIVPTPSRSPLFPYTTLFRSVLSATHRDLMDMLRQGRFREDLYYRLNVVNIHIPPLDKRREDIPLLVAHFLQEIAKESGQERSEDHTSELQSRENLVCRLLLE